MSNTFCTSLYSFRGSYSFLELGMRQIFKGGNYSKEERILGRKLHEEIRNMQAWSFHFFNKIMAKSYLDGLGTWINVSLEVPLEDQRHCYRFYTQCKSVLMLLESNIMLQMDLQWIFHVESFQIQNVIVLQYSIWQVGIVIRKATKLAGFIKVNTIRGWRSLKITFDFQFWCGNI